MAVDLSWYTKNSKNKSILSLIITLFFCLLHMSLWLCIDYKLSSLAPTQFADHTQAEASNVIVNLTTVGIVVDLVCVIISFLALYGIRKDFKGRHYLYAWIFSMILYLFLESLISWCFIYWAYKKEMLLFVLISSFLFWSGRTTILIGCMIQVASHFSSIIKRSEIPAIIVAEQPSLGQGARKRRTPSVATVSTTISNISNPDAVCEKQYPGYLPYSIDFDTMYPSYLFDDYDPTMYPPDFSYDCYQYPEYPQHLVSPSYEEATSSTAHNPPPYSTAENLNPPSYTEADQNLVVSAQVIDSTCDSGLIRGAMKP